MSVSGKSILWGVALGTAVAVIPLREASFAANQHWLEAPNTCMSQASGNGSVIRASCAGAGSTSSTHVNRQMNSFNTLRQTMPTRNRIWV
jgi:hypothetical protein